MPFTDLLRTTVFITGAEATTAIAIGRDDASTTLFVALAWWLVASAIGFWLGRPARAAEDMRDLLASAKTATSLPPQSPARIAVGRLWPMALFAIAAGA